MYRRVAAQAARRHYRNTLAALGAALGMTLAGAAVGAEPAQADPLQQGAAPLSLGMSYVVPPHVPGAKVRTPEGLAPLLAERLEQRLPLQAVAVPADSVVAGAADVLLLSIDEDDARRESRQVIPTGYRAGIMAIMRTDTDIKRWEDLRGRVVCLAEGGGLAGQMQARYGAVEKVYRAPADALLDLRIGGCDATVHDSTMLEALLEFPEWQKFSARLPVQQERDLAFIVSEEACALADVLQSQVKTWQESELLAKLTKQAARDIAFEVYMDQEVPDCH